MKVMIVVTHLLGTGHLSRALILGRAFAEQNHDVLVISGGMPAPQLDTSGLTLLSLPPLRSDGADFTRLLDQNGAIADAAYFDARTTGLTQAIRSFEPQILITELYPFGRRSLAAEFRAALKAARELPQPSIILNSIRDILAPPSKPAKANQADEIIAEYYDGVLVHSDPQITPLSVSWPVTPQLASRLHYTGFVAPTAPPHHPDGIGQGEIVVSAGGGSVGQPIFQAAIEAARKMPNKRWRLLVGGQDAKARIAKLSQLAEGASIILEPVRPDFRQMLPLVEASVSMCGYNTAMDVLQSGTPAVLIPFDDGQEVEQGLRARALSHLDGIEVLNSSNLSGPTLANALGRALSSAVRPPMTEGFNGAHRSVEIATELFEARP
ncbi:glycosyltransferase [uncultured Ruegeria sp.]|uniref:glycosyltransferase family protein n=1 Tax=uncultured Ruegeria sp. TaxID=259304 RepID=UPI00261844DB|nr:glycosyltransferase [uncultured Ruegeria sp.]